MKSLLCARVFLAGLATGAALTSCDAFRPPLLGPEKGGDPWTELTSDDLVLYTDFARDEAREQFSQFEALIWELEQAAFPRAKGPQRRAVVVLFKRPADYAAVGPPGSAGVFRSQLPLDIERVPALVVSGGLTSEIQRRFVHEMVHERMQRAYGNTPPWLNEGLADYFSTIRVAGADLILGDVVPERALPFSYVPTVSEIVRADHSSFRATDADHTLPAARYYTGRGSSSTCCATDRTTTGSASTSSWRV